MEQFKEWRSFLRCSRIDQIAVEVRVDEFVVLEVSSCFIKLPSRKLGKNEPISWRTESSVGGHMKTVCLYIYCVTWALIIIYQSCYNPFVNNVNVDLCTHYHLNSFNHFSFISTYSTLSYQDKCMEIRDWINDSWLLLKMIYQKLQGLGASRSSPASSSRLIQLKEL